MRLLVTGGREYRDRAKVFATLDHVHKAKGIDVLIHGGCSGADSLADEWAERHHVLREPYPVPDWVWVVLGNAAGPKRNQCMVSMGKPDGAVAFPGGAGTASCVECCKAAGVKVLEVTE
jgi:hypothetical protein